MDVQKILEEATLQGASDIFIIPMLPIKYKHLGVMESMDDHTLRADDTHEFIQEIYKLADRDISHFEETGDDDFSFAIPGISRYRVSTFKQRGSYSAVIRIIVFNLPSPEELKIPASVMDLADTGN